MYCSNSSSMLLKPLLRVVIRGSNRGRLVVNSQCNTTTTTNITSSSSSSILSSSSLNATSNKYCTNVTLQKSTTTCYLSSSFSTTTTATTSNNNNNNETSSSLPMKMKYASINHSNSYETQMSGLHGRQLNLAYEESKRNEGKYLPDNLLDEYSVTLDDLLLNKTKVGGTTSIEKDNDSISASEEEEERDDEVTTAGEEDYDNDDEDDFLMDNEDEYNIDEIKFPSRQISKDNQIAYKAGAASGGNFAIIALNDGTTQHKVALDDVIVVNKLKPLSKWNVGETITLDPHEVLLLGSTSKTIVGLPGITSHGGTVKVHVEEITRDATTITFKKRRKKHSQRKRGSRREVTFLRIVEININANDNTNEQQEKEKSKIIMDTTA